MLVSERFISFWKGVIWKKCVCALFKRMRSKSMSVIHFIVLPTFGFEPNFISFLQTLRFCPYAPCKPYPNPFIHLIQFAHDFVSPHCWPATFDGTIFQLMTSTDYLQRSWLIPLLVNITHPLHIRCNGFYGKHADIIAISACAEFVSVWFQEEIF